MGRKYIKFFFTIRSIWAIESSITLVLRLSSGLGWIKMYLMFLYGKGVIPQSHPRKYISFLQITVPKGCATNRWSSENIVRRCYDTDITPGSERSGRLLETGWKHNLEKKDIFFLLSPPFALSLLSLFCFWQDENGSRHYGARVVVKEKKVTCAFSANFWQFI